MQRGKVCDEKKSRESDGWKRVTFVTRDPIVQQRTREGEKRGVRQQGNKGYTARLERGGGLRRGATIWATGYAIGEVERMSGL